MLALTPRGAELELHVNLLRHGRRTCHAQRPGVRGCALRRMCPSVAVAASRGAVVRSTYALATRGRAASRRPRRSRPRADAAARSGAAPRLVQPPARRRHVPDRLRSSRPVRERSVRRPRPPRHRATDPAGSRSRGVEPPRRRASRPPGLVRAGRSRQPLVLRRRTPTTIGPTTDRTRPSGRRGPSASRRGSPTIAAERAGYAELRAGRRAASRSPTSACSRRPGPRPRRPPPDPRPDARVRARARAPGCTPARSTARTRCRTTAPAACGRSGTEVVARRAVEICYTDAKIFRR